MARLKREESQAQTRAKLLDAGRSQVVARGFVAASVRDIAEAAGFSQGAFYSNFESKEDLLLELLHSQKQTEVAQLNAALDSIRSKAEARGALDAWITEAATHRDWAILAVELELHAARNEAFRAKYEALASEHIELVGKLIGRIFHALGHKVPAGSGGHGGVGGLAAGFIALTHGLTLQRPELTREDWVATVQLFVEGVLAAAR